MRYLTLIRHAKSSWKDKRLPDLTRPLNRRGEVNAPEMGRRLSQSGVSFEHMFSSPATRAIVTAEAIASVLQLPSHHILVCQNLYTFSSDDILAFIRCFDSTMNHVAIVCHNPAMTDLLNHLSGADIENVPTCGVARLRFAVDDWREADADTAKLLSFDYPKSHLLEEAVAS